jgi:hypothetical protein
MISNEIKWLLCVGTRAVCAVLCVGSGVPIPLVHLARMSEVVTTLQTIHAGHGCACARTSEPHTALTHLIATLINRVAIRHTHTTHRPTMRTYSYSEGARGSVATENQSPQTLQRQRARDTRLRYTGTATSIATLLSLMKSSVIVSSMQSSVYWTSAGTRRSGGCSQNVRTASCLRMSDSHSIFLEWPLCGCRASVGLRTRSRVP